MQFIDEIEETLMPLVHRECHMKSSGIEPETQLISSSFISSH
jgi:hypothetical protein